MVIHAVAQKWKISNTLYVVVALTRENTQIICNLSKRDKTLNLTQRLTIELLNEYRNWLKKMGYASVDHFSGCNNDVSNFFFMVTNN